MNLLQNYRYIIFLLTILFYPSISLGQNQIKICLTGRVVDNFKSYGQSFRNAANLALEQSGLADKVLIESFFYNNRPLEPIRAYKKIVHQGCSAIIGFEYLSDLLLAIKEQKNNKIPIFTSYASTKVDERLPDNIFVFMPSYNHQVKQMLNFMHHRFKIFESILIITEVNRDEMLRYKDVYSQALNTEKIEYDTFDFLENDKNFPKKLQKFLNQKKYKYIFLLSGAIASAKIADAINDNKTIFIGTENFGSSVSPTFSLLLKNKTIKSYFIRNIDYIKPSKALFAFKKLYVRKYNEQPTILAAYAYDAISIVLKAFKETGNVSTKNIYKINYSGVTGAILKNKTFHRSEKSIILAVKKDGYFYEK